LDSYNYPLGDKRNSSLIKFIEEKKIKKINIIGSPGSGKTTLSKYLKKILMTEMLNIDSLFESTNDNSLIENIIVDKLSTTKKIIIDGTYSSLLTPERINNTDLFVLVDSSIINSILKVIRRAVKGKNEYKNERLSFRLIKQIMIFEKKKDIIESRVEKNKIYYY
jgi:adenylate kinase family enzyme